jgi:hypothetical protein
MAGDPFKPELLTVYDFQQWAKSKWEPYACCKTRTGKKVKLRVSIAGEAVVFLDDEEGLRYSGDNIRNAIRVYNAILED